MTTPDKKFPLALAMRMAKHQPLVLPSYLPENYKKFLSLLFWLQRLFKNELLKVQTKPLAMTLDLPCETIIRFREWAQSDGWLVLRDRPIDDPKKYSFAVEKINEETLEPFVFAPPDGPARNAHGSVQNGRF